jgi:hypothetical protein
MFFIAIADVHKKKISPDLDWISEDSLVEPSTVDD